MAARKKAQLTALKPYIKINADRLNVGDVIIVASCFGNVDLVVKKVEPRASNKGQLQNDSSLL